MKPTLAAFLLCMHLGTAVSGATFSIPAEDDASGGLPNSETGNGLLGKLGFYNDQKREAIKLAAQAATEALDTQIESVKAHALGDAYRLVDKAQVILQKEYGRADADGDEIEDIDTATFVDFGDAMRACEKRDCKRPYFFNETLRWIKKALIDAGIFIYENPMATAALFIGVSALVASLVSSGALLPAALEVIGFGAKGPIAGSIAAAIQKQLGIVKVGSAFAQLQSAAMNGAPLITLQKSATAAFAGLGFGIIAAGSSHLIAAGTKPLGLATDFEPTEWKVWEARSRVDYTPDLANKMVRLWGTPTAEGCVAHGYREYRAPIWFVPNGIDPVTVCLQTPAAIEGIGFKTPLGCADEGLKKGVIGTWYVQSNETTCMPRWSEFEDEGCMQYGRRRMFARLLGLRRQDDWANVCESTPARVRGEDYDGPTYCEDKGVLGIYGIVDVPDAKCECYCGGA